MLLDLPSWVRYISAPLIGAIIGYFTNLLAVKMLFRPYYPKKIGKHTLPFTPGIIPKRRKALAKAIGVAISDNLITNEDLSKSLLNESTKNKVIGTLMSKLYTNESLNDNLLPLLGDETLNSLNNKLNTLVTDEIYKAILNMDIEEKVTKLGKDYFESKRSSLGMLAMFLSDEKIEGLLHNIGASLANKLETSGKDLISPYVAKEIDKIANESLNELTLSFDKNNIYLAIAKIYDNVMLSIANSLFSSLDLASIAENKINAMDIKDLEKLILSVMKKELNAIVNLGALIGFILGLINIII